MQAAEAQSATREATLADVDRIESLTLEDFAVDLKSVTLPEGPIKDGDLSRAADRFLGALRSH